MNNLLKSGAFILAAMTTLAGQAQASGGNKTYELTCGIANGASALEAVKTGRVYYDAVSLDGVTGFGSYKVEARGRYVTATVTESLTNQSNQFSGKIEIHGGGHSLDSDSLESHGGGHHGGGHHGGGHHHGEGHHSQSGFQISVTPSESGAERVTLVCTARRLY